MSSGLTLASRLSAHATVLARHLAQSEEIALYTGMRGNIGDHLIWAGTNQLLDHHGIHPVPVGDAELHGPRRPGCLLIPGSGAFSPWFHEWLPAVVERAADIYDEVLILPSAFDPSVPEVHRALSRPNVVAMARDPFSYRRITRYGRANLALDLALHHPAFDPALALKPVHDDAVLVSLRTDQGSVLPQHGLAVHPDRNHDIAAETDDLTHYIAAVQRSSFVVTDRLHVVITSVMTGTPVAYVDPYDQKISRYLDFTFGDAASHLLRHVDYDWLLRHDHVVKAP